MNHNYSMKKIILLTLISLPAFADVYQVPGNVQVWTSGTRQYMQATMNVRFNTALAGAPYMLANGSVNSSVTFAGRDSNYVYFSCSVSTSSPFYAAAVDAKNNLTNGGRLYIYKQVGSSDCESFSLGNYSYYQF